MSKSLRFIGGIVLLGIAVGLWAYAQDQSTFRVKVDMVVLGFTVTDNKGKYVNGLKPKDFKVFEDDINQKLATFTEGNHAPLQVLENNETRPLHAEGSADHRQADLPRRGDRVLRL